MLIIPTSKEFQPYKDHKWRFTAECDQDTIYPLLIKVQTLAEALAELPHSQLWKQDLKDELIRRSIFGTAAIEGNSLSEQEVAEELKLKNPRQDSTRAQQEIANLRNLYRMLDEAEHPDKALDEDLVKSFHAKISEGLAFDDNIPGQYRVSKVQVGDIAHGGIYTPPKARVDVINLMTCLFEWINSEEVQQFSPILRAACAHYYLVRIHPFRDGNGRTARFAEAYILARAGMGLVAPMLSNYYYQHIDDYFISISATGKAKNMTPFFLFFLTGLFESLKDLHKNMAQFLKVLVMRDYVDFLKRNKYISQRQKTLLDIMHYNLKYVTVNQLFEDPSLLGYYKGLSKQTGRRDLNKLRDLALLIQDEEKYFINYDI